MIEHALTELARRKDILVISDRPLKEFANAHPGRYVAAPANAIDVATGIAIEGKTPVIVSSALTPTDLANARHGIIVLSSANFHNTPAPAHVTLISPANTAETEAAIAAQTSAPTFIALERLPHKEHTPFTPGKTMELRAGEDCTIISTGTHTHRALKAAEQLGADGIACTVLHAPTIQPLDRAVKAYARRTQCIVTVGPLALHHAVSSLLQNNQIAHAHQDITRTVEDSIHSHCTRNPPTKNEHPPSPFYLRGNAIHSLAELHHALLTMRDRTFTRHCNTAKNDFTAWIASGNPALADALQNKKGRLALARALNRWLT